MRICVIDPRWRIAEDGRSKFGYFELAQNPGAVDRMIAGHPAYSIFDNGAYENEMVPLRRYKQQIDTLYAAGARPVVVSPDDTDGYTNAALFSALLDFTPEDLPLMIVARAKPETFVIDIVSAGTACVLFNEKSRNKRPLYIGLPIRDFAYVGLQRSGGVTNVQKGPEWLRAQAIKHLRTSIVGLVSQGVNFHLLGLGWDWWNVQEYRDLPIASIDSAKPARYAMAGLNMVEHRAYFDLPRATILADGEIPAFNSICRDNAMTLWTTANA